MRNNNIVPVKSTTILHFHPHFPLKFHFHCIYNGAFEKKSLQMAGTQMKGGLLCLLTIRHSRALSGQNVKIFPIKCQKRSKQLSDFCNHIHRTFPKLRLDV